jgi:inorganic pyrophosphatase
MKNKASFAILPTFDADEDGALLAVIETPKGSRNKYAFNHDLQGFELRKVLPRGMIFPYDFGFIPSTKAEDGDPLDVLLLLDDPAPMGCIVRVRAVGAIEAEQREDGGAWVRNDRLIAVAIHAQLHGNVKSLKELNPKLLDEMEAFFRNYNESQGNEFRVLDRCGPKTALQLVEASRR